MCVFNKIPLEVVSQRRICRPQPPQKWPSQHKRCAMCLKKIMGTKFHITSYRVYAPQAPEYAQNASKIQLSLNVTKFAGYIGINLALIFCEYDI